MPATKAPYVLTNVDTKEVRLVRAKSATAAVLHVASPWTCDVATHDDLIEHLQAGVKVEDASQPAQAATAVD